MRFMFLADEAERRGDARAALDIIETSLREHPVENFWRPWRIDRLFQLAILGRWLPRWATSRWIVEQALQDLAPKRRLAHLEVLRIAIELRGGLAALPGRDEDDARSKVIDGDWVYRQLYLYEYGGLAHFVRHRAAADLLVGADRIHAWARASMGGFELLGQGPAVTTWRDLATGDRVETTTLGSGALVLPGEHVIGRLVPIDGGAMFETAPLLVPEAVAQKVAADPECWLDALRDERAAGCPVETGGRAFGFLSDLPRPLHLVGVIPDQILLDGCSDSAAVVTALMATARAALDRPEKAEDPAELSPWPCLATAFLNSRIIRAIGEAPEVVDREVLGRLGGVLAEPAAAICLGLALIAEDAA